MSGAPSIVIVGAGVSGCFAAQMLHKALPAARITLIDRLPVPFGLLRYGVAADHQGSKAVQQQFERLLQCPQVKFHGGLELGSAFGLGQLNERFDAVVLATGLREDRRLGVSGEELGGVIGSGRLTRALNSHPDEYANLPRIASRLAVVGSGNVAVDILRLLCKGHYEWGNSDMDDEVLRRVVPDAVQDIHLLSRSSAADARWDPAMLSELATLARPVFRLGHGCAWPVGSTTAQALARLLEGPNERPGEVRIHLHFSARVEAILGNGQVSGVCVRAANGERLTLDVGTVVTAIGFEGQQDSPALPRLYRTGWLRTGAQGTIAQQRVLAKRLADEIVADLESGVIDSGRPGWDALAALATSDYRAWCRIDNAERERALPGRVRRKIAGFEQLHELASEPDPITSIGQD
ncbi:FAD-dependent oxidoreductase [Pseudomonas sp. LRF_L74]|uniref:FAD-dependent oxidoreductase n=1 Tax=Pseudomonas sp. LRF_L74 TaxID=3369422 RepID=UPI003F5DCE04